jgi:hypothetical protein
MKFEHWLADRAKPTALMKVINPGPRRKKFSEQSADGFGSFLLPEGVEKMDEKIKTANPLKRFLKLDVRQKIIFWGITPWIIIFAFIYTHWLSNLLRQLFIVNDFTALSMAAVILCIGTIFTYSLAPAVERKLLKEFADAIWNGFAIISISLVFAVALTTNSSSAQTLSGLVAKWMQHPVMFSALVTSLISAAAAREAVSIHGLFVSFRSLK